MSRGLEGLDEFLTKAEKAHDLVNLLKSEDENVLKNTQDEIDTILRNDWEDVEDGEYACHDGFSKSCVNKNTETTGSTGAEIPGGGDFPPEQEGFMRAVAEDADRRAENRKKKEEKAKIRKEKGNEAFKRGEYEEAIKQYDIAIQLTGWNVALYTNKAQSYIKLKEYDSAIAACDRALYIEEDFVKAYIQKSNALVAQCSYSQAVECLNLCNDNCKGSRKIVKKYLYKASNLLNQHNDNNDILETCDQEQRKEFEHLIEKLSSDKVFEVTISADFLMKSLQNSAKHIRLFRALGGISAVTRQIGTALSEHLVLSTLLDVLKLCVVKDRISLFTWLYLDPLWAESLSAHFTNDQLRYSSPQVFDNRMLLLTFIQKLVFEDDDVCEALLEHWVDASLTGHLLDCFNRRETRSLTVLIVGQIIRHHNFLLRFQKEISVCLRAISSYLPNILQDNNPAQLRTWVAGLSGLSMTHTARKLLDTVFWSLFLPLLARLEKEGDVKTVDDLLATGQNFAVDSAVLGQGHGEAVTKELVRLCGEGDKWVRAPLLLNRVLEKCPNSALSEDKAQFSSVLKVIKESERLDDDVNTAIKLLTRTTAVSPQARKWVVKYQVLDKLLEVLGGDDVTPLSPKTYTAIMSNAALCAAHCFQDESVCKKRDAALIDLMLRHARADKGLAIQQNAAIALARLATNNPVMLQRLRELGGLEVLHSRYSET